MTRLSLIVLLGLCSCAAPEIVYKPVPVDTPTPIKCVVKDVPKPSFQLPMLKPSDSLYVKVQAALEDDARHKSYETLLVAESSACK